MTLSINPGSVKKKKKPEERTFHPYPRLPNELKLMIWDKLIKAIPRRCHTDTSLYYGPRKETEMQKAQRKALNKARRLNGKEPVSRLNKTLDDPLNQLLHICHHSRITYLKHYTAWGAYITGIYDFKAERKFSYAYVNFNKDSFELLLHDCASHRKRKQVIMFTPGLIQHYRSMEVNGVGRIRKATVRIDQGENHGSRSRYKKKSYDSGGVVLTEAEFLERVLRED